ncbi:peptidoglycan-binding protein [Streptomyces sp. ME19-01-6]|uniref:peptidoglycan-binding protein n=1 Tax=Streptomyces sp. ME19-01-6 TaxID=3028686 RepID=UPI0029A95354|nr:peptidoglycan-binding protein [Streptomyces sp. ME19-01-6]MDX3224165.1 peptidoglycan-binding protein [Streptomyces sp. ME19-01-6]
MSTAARGGPRPEADRTRSEDADCREAAPGKEPDNAVPGGVRGRSHLSRRRRVLTGVVAGAVLMTGAGLGASTLIKSPAEAAADTGPPASDVLTAPVERRVLTDSVVIRGMVAAGQSVDVAPSVSGGDAFRPVVTRLPVKTGAPVRSGQVLAEVSGRPVFALPGKLPAYRDLKPGAHGNDVTQLQQALRSLGHRTGGDASGIFGEGTKSALNAFYASLGYDPLPAAADGADKVKAAQEAVTEAERTWQDAKGAAASATSRSGDTSTPVAGGGGTAQGESRQVRRAAEDLAAAREELAAARAADGPMLPASEVVYLKGFPARIESLAVSVGATVSGKIMTVSAGALVVKGNLASHQKGLVRTGQKVEILSEVTGVTAPGRVTSVSDTPKAAVADPAQGDRAQAGTSGAYAVVIRPDRPLKAELARQDVRLTVQAASSQGKVLVVPVSAVSAGADGTTVVTIHQASRDRRVEVTLGTSGDGYTEIRPRIPGAVEVGDRVVVGVRQDDGPGSAALPTTATGGAAE